MFIGSLKTVHHFRFKYGTIMPVRDVSHPIISLLSFSFFSLQADPPLGNPPAEGQTNFLSLTFLKIGGQGYP